MQSNKGLNHLRSMECRVVPVVENCQPSEKCTQSQTFINSKPPVEINEKTSDEQKVSENDKEICEETDKADVVLNPCHGRSDSINGTKSTANDTSLNTIIGNILKPQDTTLPSRVAVISISLEKPLFVTLGNSLYVTATISLCK